MAKTIFCPFSFVNLLLIKVINYSKFQLRTGVLIKLVCIPVTVLAASTWITSIAGLEEFPDWANSTLNSL